jgi:hypothetical protein
MMMVVMMFVASLMTAPMMVHVRLFGHRFVRRHWLGGTRQRAQRQG